MNPPPPDGLSGSAPEAAPRLLGCVLSHAGVAVRITEVEAYAGFDDPASHAYRGPTPRTRSMFGPGGHLYCYLSYGIHVCANVTLEPEGRAGAVLLRAGRIVEGGARVRTRSSERSRPLPERDLARGPGRLGWALALELAHDGVDLRSGPVRLTPGETIDSTRVRSGPRVGVRRASDRPWRFWLADDPTVSAYRRSPRAGLT